MHLRYLTPMLSTNDLAGTIAFYTGVLGFELDEYNEEWGWCHLHKDQVTLMFTKPNSHQNPEGKIVFTGSFYMYTNEVDAAWEELKNKTEISYGIENFAHGMREFAILDNNGYILQFGRELSEEELIINN